MGLDYQVFSPDVDENLSGPPEKVVRALAERKAKAAAQTYPNDLVLAADTLVCVNGVSLGKPTDESDAKRMLRLLSGSWHEVYTGVCLITKAKTLVEMALTQVFFAPLNEEEMDEYIKSGEPFGKAGAYAIQGRASMYIEEIRGSYTNVVGLPTSMVRMMLQKID